MQELPLVYGSCKSANTGKKRRDSTQRVDPSGGKKWSSADVSPHPMSLPFKATIEQLRGGRRRAGKRESLPAPSNECEEGPVGSRLNLPQEKLPEPETKPARWPGSPGRGSQILLHPRPTRLFQARLRQAPAWRQCPLPPCPQQGHLGVRCTMPAP